MELCRSGRIVERDLSVAIAIASRRRFSLTRKDGIKWRNSCTERFFLEFQNIMFSKKEKQNCFRRLGKLFGLWATKALSLGQLFNKQNWSEQSPKTSELTRIKESSSSRISWHSLYVIMTELSQPKISSHRQVSKDHNCPEGVILDQGVQSLHADWRLFVWAYPVLAESSFDKWVYSHL